MIPFGLLLWSSTPNFITIGQEVHLESILGQEIGSLILQYEVICMCRTKQSSSNMSKLDAKTLGPITRCLKLSTFHIFKAHGALIGEFCAVKGVT